MEKMLKFKEPHANELPSTLPIPAFVINLPRDVERRDSTLTSLAAVGIVARVWEAFDGGTLSPDQVGAVAKNSLRTEGRALSRSEIGCAMSHLCVYEYIVERDLPLALVLEDDALVGPAFVDVVRFLIAQRIQPDGLHFDFVNFITDAEQRRFGRIDDCHHLTTFANPANGTSCYLITLKGARNLLVSGQPIRWPADGLTGRTRVTGIDSKGVQPPVASLAGFLSTQEVTCRRTNFPVPDSLYRTYLSTRRVLSHLGLR